MKRDGAAPGLLLFAALSAWSMALASTPVLEAPPGWSDAGAAGKAEGIVIALRGPEKSSFVVKRAPGAPLDNPAGTRGYLQDVLKGVRDASRRDYRTNGRVETRAFANGLSARVLRAQLLAEDRLILGIFEAEGQPYLAVLLSAAPEAMLPSLLGAVELGGTEGSVQSAGTARSPDGQLEIALGGGLRARTLLNAERGKGFVLVIQGAGSEIFFQKISDAESTRPAEQAAIVRALAAASAGVPVRAASLARPAPSAAGPVGVYSWAEVAGEPGVRAAAGYLPWGYWGYQMFGRGPSADVLMLSVLAALKAGPGAVTALVSGSPVIPVSGAYAGRRFWAVSALGLAACLLLWSLRRKNASLSQ